MDSRNQAQDSKGQDKKESRPMISFPHKPHEIVIILLAIILATGILVLVDKQLRASQQRTWSPLSCASHLKMIGLALRQYAEDNNGFYPPENGAAGLEYLRKTKILEHATYFTCPSTKISPATPNTPLTENTVSYIYMGAGLTANDSPDSPIAWDKPHNHDRYGNILFLDGRVIGFPGENWLKDGIASSKTSDKHEQ